LFSAVTLQALQITFVEKLKKILRWPTDSSRKTKSSKLCRGGRVNEASGPAGRGGIAAVAPLNATVINTAIFSFTAGL